MPVLDITISCHICDMAGEKKRKTKNTKKKMQRIKGVQQMRRV